MAHLAAQSVDPNDVRRNKELVQRTGSKEAAIQKLLDDVNAYYRRGYFELSSGRLNRARLLQNEK